jgi:hypothetical protein
MLILGLLITSDFKSDFFHVVSILIRVGAVWSHKIFIGSSNNGIKVMAIMWLWWAILEDE